MRFADAAVLPYRFTGLSDAVQRDLDEVQKLLKTRQEEAREQNLKVEEGYFSALHDPREPASPPQPERVPPFINLTPVQNGLDTLTHAAARYDRALRQATAGDGVPAAALARANAELKRAERLLLAPEGLPRRPWYRNLITAPGYATGYAAKTLPGVREAIEDKRWDEAGTEAARLGRALMNEADGIGRAAAALEGR
jgi:N-acetylated-alpha-linked acidic dipeptidase